MVRAYCVTSAHFVTHIQLIFRKAVLLLVHAVDHQEDHVLVVDQGLDQGVDPGMCISKVSKVPTSSGWHWEWHLLFLITCEGNMVSFFFYLLSIPEENKFNPLPRFLKIFFLASSYFSKL